MIQKLKITSIQWCVPTITPSAERKKAIYDLLLASDFIPFIFLKRGILLKILQKVNHGQLK